MKKILSILIATTILACNLTGLFVSAADQPTSKIVIQNDTAKTGLTLVGRTFDVYKIFDATVNNEPSSGYATIAYTVDSKFETLFTSLAGSSEKDAIENYVHEQYDANDNAKMQALVKKIKTEIEGKSIANVSTISGDVSVTGTIQTLSSGDLTPGYYLVLDKTAGETVTAGILVSIPTKDSAEDFTKNAVIDIKGSQPGVEKSVWHNDLNGGKGEWDDVADYAIGDKVKFLIKVDVPSNLDGYTEYKFELTDTMSDGLTYNVDSMKIYLDKGLTTEAEGKLHTETIYENDPDGKVFNLDFDMLAIKKKFPLLEEFYVYYTATLNEKANISLEFETNKVELDYSNSPYDNTSFGKDEDTVKVYTFGLNVKKTDTALNPLADAKFGLYISPLSETEEDHPVYLAKDPTSNTYYVQKTGTVDVPSNSGIIVTDATGLFTINGLDDGVTYVLKELEAPNGYTQAGDVIFLITATYDENNIPTIKTSSKNITTSNSGYLETTIINKSSSLFPGTGGMGTPIFIVGGVLVMLLALVISKKTSTTTHKEIYKDN